MDNIVRGVKSGQKGLMTLALYDLISWVFISFNYHTVYLRVFSDNKRAINMYSRLKFNEKRKFALEKSFSKNNVIQYNILNDKHAEGKYFSYMELDKNDHFLNYKNIKIRD
jgi:RimJ/RimL family protein N-acetyltransferase